MHQISSTTQAVALLSARLSKGELVIVDRERLEARLRAEDFEPHGAAWLKDLLDGTTTIVWMDGAVLSFTFARLEQRIAVGNQLIEACAHAVTWPSLGHAA